MKKKQSTEGNFIQQSRTWFALLSVPRKKVASDKTIFAILHEKEREREEDQARWGKRWGWRVMMKGRKNGKRRAKNEW